MPSSWHTLLPELGVLALSGQDAARFLQGQATCDILGLPPGQTSLGAFCTPKGRVLAVFRVLRLEDRIFLLLPAELLGSVRERLQRYVLRSAVKIEDVSAQWSVFGLFGGAAAAALQSLGLPPLERENEAEGQGGFYTSFYAIRIPDPGDRRFLVLLDAAKAKGMGRFLEARGLPPATPMHWRLEDIRAGIPTVTMAAVEEFVPQMLNLDLLGGISFNKGCYTGQEIVARTHYLGHSKRRLRRLTGKGWPLPQAGEAVSREGGEGQAVGMIVDCAETPEGGFELLAVLASAELLSAGQLKSAGGLDLSLAALPYPVEDAAAPA